MKSIALLDETERSVIGAVREIKELEIRRKEIVNAYDTYVRKNGFRGFKEAIIGAKPGPVLDKIEAFEKELTNLENKMDSMRDKIGYFV